MPFFAALAALLLASPVLAEGPKHTIGIIEENDVFALGGGDSHYTQGLKLFYLRRDDKGRVKRLEPGWLKPHDPQAAYYWGIVLGQNMFTPRDIAIAAADPDDRPYAGFLYTGLALQRAQSDTLDTAELDLGVVGPDSKAKEAQTIVHEIKGVSLPRGWAHQLTTRWSAQLSLQRRWRIGRVNVLGWIPFDSVPHAGAVVGNVHDEINMGNTIRLGIGGLPEDFGADYIVTPAPSIAGRSAYAATLFARVDGRIVAYNSFLDRERPGGTPKVEREAVVADIALGATLRIRTARLVFSQLWRTTEFKTQIRPHKYASLSLSLSL